jgi:hypothetical protein
MKKLNLEQLETPIIWWEKKRIWFNVIVGFAGIYIIIFSEFFMFSFKDIVGILIWGFIANILYSAGVILEIMNVYYLKSNINFFRFRYVFWLLGTFLYAAWTAYYAFFYFNDPFLW